MLRMVYPIMILFLFLNQLKNRCDYIFDLKGEDRMKKVQKEKMFKSKMLCFVTMLFFCVMVFVPSVSAEAKWVKAGKNQYRYTTNESGTKYYKNKWVKISGKYYYFDKKGYRKTGWLNYKGKKYYLKSSGVRTTGFKTIKKKKYYFSKKGAMITGWIKYKNHYYYANSNGVIQTGLQLINNYVYCFDKNGKRISDAQIVFGNMSYYFGSNGVLQYTGTEIEKAVKYVNVQRMLFGYEPLTYYINCNLQTAAYSRAKELSVSQSHLRPNGSHYSTIIASDYPVSVYWSGECVSWGTPKSGTDVAYHWLTNENANVLLQKEANGISIGTYIDEKGCEYWSALVVQTR